MLRCINTSTCSYSEDFCFKKGLNDIFFLKVLDLELLETEALSSHGSDMLFPQFPCDNQFNLILIFCFFRSQDTLLCCPEITR